MAVASSLSGKFVLRVSPELHAELKERALREERSLNQICVELIEAGLSGADTKSGSFTELQDSLRKKFGSRFIGLLLFGSYARGEERQGSDIDLLAVLAPEVPLVRSLYDEWQGNLPANISLHFSHLPEKASEAGSLWLECALDGRILSDPQRRIGRMISAIKEVITSGSVIRKVTHGQGYWVHL